MRLAVIDSFLKMDREVNICVLILCGILSQEISASDENGNLLDLLVRNKRFIGGVDTPLQQAPYVVNIFANCVNACTGSLLSPGFAITAAHCFDFPQGTNYIMLSGSPMSGSGIPHNITQNIPHPLLRSDDESHDVALFKFLPLINFTKSPNRPIKLYHGPLLSNSCGTISSWGCSQINGDEKLFPNQLQSATLPIISLQECRNFYKAYKNFIITEQYICTSSGSTKIRCDVGDSGAPLVVSGHLVGVMSWGAQSCTHMPDVFVSMLHNDFRTWISQHVPSALSSC